MRVIAGTARGRALKTPRGMSTRPMMDIVKGSLFNMLEALGGVGGDVLDLFAGSGSLGIEALSRGANRADFVEQNREACKIIAENLSKLGFAQQGRVITKAVEPFVASAREQYDFIFMDAPYAARVSARLLDQLAQGDILRTEACVCIGHHKHERLPDAIGRLTRIKYRCFGASCISIYQYSASVN